MKYLKHYWISTIDDTYCSHENTINRRHPEQEYPGLDVRIWLEDQTGINLCVSQVPDTTEVVDIFDTQDPDLKVVQILTKEQFDSISALLVEVDQLIIQSREETDSTATQSLYQQAEQKRQDAIDLLASF